MASIRLYLDEDVFPLLAEILRQRGFDAVSAHELGRTCLPDSDHLEYAIRERRNVLTFNIGDFVVLANQQWQARESFPGVIISTQIPFKEALRRVQRLLSRRTEEDIRDSIIWLNDFR